MHGSIRASSVFTSESGEWKLGGFDVLSSMKEDDAVIYVGCQAVARGSYADPSRHTAVWCPTQDDTHPLR